MKKILSLILAAAMLLLISVPVFAAELNVDGAGNNEATEDVNVSHTVGNALTGNGSADSDVTHTVQGGYMITIPASVVFAKDEETQTCVFNSEVGVASVQVPGDLYISLESNNYNDGWQLVSQRGDTLEYTINVGSDEDGYNSVENNGNILHCPYGTFYLKKALVFELIETEAKSVSYTDTLTFTVSVK